jgi:mono/diheme cytochrome c family protein
MRRILKWIGYGLAGIVVLLVVATAIVYVMSARLLGRTYDVPGTEVAVTSRAGAVAEGKRLATIRGCIGCHGPALEGDVLFDDLLIARLSSPNLSQLARTYSDAELERLIRHGVRKNGRSVLAMPSSMFAHLADADLGTMVSYVRSVPPVDHDLSTTRIGPLGRLGLLLGQFHPEAAVIDHGAAHAAVAPSADRLAFGKYLGVTSCLECHGPDLRGQAGAPSLAIAVGYSDQPSGAS